MTWTPPPRTPASTSSPSPSSASPAKITAPPPVALAAVLDSEPGLRRRPHERRRLWLDRVLETRCGHPLILAALAAEVGRRAGLEVHVLSAPTGWYAGLADGERLWLVDATMDGRRADPWSLRPHCAHELAFAALMGLSDRFERVGDTQRAGRAALLRSRLPLRG